MRPNVICIITYLRPQREHFLRRERGDRGNRRRRSSALGGRQLRPLRTVKALGDEVRGPSGGHPRPFYVSLVMLQVQGSPLHHAVGSESSSTLADSVHLLAGSPMLVGSPLLATEDSPLPGVNACNCVCISVNLIVFVPASICVDFPPPVDSLIMIAPHHHCPLVARSVRVLALRVTHWISRVRHLPLRQITRLIFTRMFCCRPTRK